MLVILVEIVVLVFLSTGFIRSFFGSEGGGCLGHSLVLWMLSHGDRLRLY